MGLKCKILEHYGGFSRISNVMFVNNGGVWLVCLLIDFANIEMEWLYDLLLQFMSMIKNIFQNRSYTDQSIENIWFEFMYI